MSVKLRGDSLQISYESQDFPANQGVTRWGQLQITWDDVLWAAITLGRPNLHYVFKHGSASGYEAIFRWSLVRMALEQSGLYGRRFQRTAAFKSLDPTEKGAINYFLGMVVCKLFASQLLNTPWLLHLDVFQDQLNPRILTSRSRPDLVGQSTTSGAWYSFECKARANTPGAKEKTKAKEQAQRLVSVDGQRCALHIGAITYFKNDILHYYWRDPEPDGPKGLSPIELKMPDVAWRDYYEPVAELIRPHTEQLADPDGEPRTARIEEADIEVGAAPEILPLLLDRTWQDLRSVTSAAAGTLRERGYRPDGLIVRSGPSWRQPFGHRRGS